MVCSERKERGNQGEARRVQNGITISWGQRGEEEYRVGVLVDSYDGLLSTLNWQP